MQDQPEHRKSNASERRENESAVDPHRELAGWASGTCLGCPCRTPDRFLTKRPETASTDYPPTRCTTCGSRIVPALRREGVLGNWIDIRAIQVSIDDVTSTSRTVEPVSSAAFWPEELVGPPSLRSVDLRFSSHGISFGGIKDLRCCRKDCARIAAQSEPERVNCMTNSVRFFVSGARSVRVGPFGSPSCALAFGQSFCRVAQPHSGVALLGSEL